MELAAKCVAAMRRAKKHKPRTRFNQLLAQEMQFIDDECDEDEGEDDDQEEQPEEEDEEEDDHDNDEKEEPEKEVAEKPIIELQIKDEAEGLCINTEVETTTKKESELKIEDTEDVDDHCSVEINNSQSTEENKVEEQMNIALAGDNLNIRTGNDLAQYMDNMSHDAQIGDFGEQQNVQNQVSYIYLNKEIIGDELSYEELFKKNKKRGRSGRLSMTDQTTGISDVTVNECNLTMTKSLRKSVFNEPMSVRGIKRIEIEEIAKSKNAKMDVNSEDSNHEYNPELDKDGSKFISFFLLWKFIAN